MFYHRMMNPNTEPFKLLTRIGGRTFKSQSKESHREDNSRNRIRISSKDKNSRAILRENRDFKIVEDEVDKEQKGESKLRKRKRGDNFKAMPL